MSNYESTKKLKNKISSDKSKMTNELKLTNSELTNSELTNSELTNSELTNSELTNSELTNSELTNSELTNLEKKMTDAKLNIFKSLYETEKQSLVTSSILSEQTDILNKVVANVDTIENKLIESENVLKTMMYWFSFKNKINPIDNIIDNKTDEKIIDKKTNASNDSFFDEITQIIKRIENQATSQGIVLQMHNDKIEKMTKKVVSSIDVSNKLSKKMKNV